MTAAPSTKPRTTRTPKAKAAAKANPDSALSDVKDEKTGKFLSIQQLKNKLRNEAEREVLDAHRSEVIERTAQKYKAHNIEYVRRLSDEEKAAKEIAESLNRFPQLRQLFSPAAADEVVFVGVDGNPEPDASEYADVEEGDPEYFEVEQREGE
jgi:hypothetical protein